VHISGFKNASDIEMNALTSGHTFTTVHNDAASITPAVKNFDAATYGYTPVEAQQFSLANTSTATLTGLQAQLTGDDAFEITAVLSGTSLAPNAPSLTVNVKPKNELPYRAEAYMAQLRIIGDNGFEAAIALAFRVNSATLTVTPAAGQTKIYGSDDPAAFGYAATGWQYTDEDDAETLLTGFLTRDPGEDAGPYEITQGSLTETSGNYTISLTPDVQFAITPATLTVTPAADQVKVYGEDDPAAFGYTAAGWQFTDEDNAETLLTGSLTRDPGENVGTYEITPGDLDVTGGNYTVSLTPDVQFAITPATLTIIPADNQAKIYGEPDPPAFFYVSIGWKYTDSRSLLTGALARAPGSDVGLYAITQGNLDVTGGNYTIDYDADVQFAITPATPSASHLEYRLADTIYDGEPYGIAAPTLKPAYTGMTGFTVSYTGVKGTAYPKSATAPTNAGAYAVTAGVSSTGPNFAAATEIPLDTLVIAKATPSASHLDYTVPSEEIAWDGVPHGIAAPTLKPAYTGMGIITVKYNGSADLPVASGAYAVTADVDAAGANFTAVTGVPLGTLTIGADPSSNEGLPAPARVWSYGGRLYIAAGAVDGRACIYNIPGVLVKIIPYTSGETVSETLPAGIYVVVTEGWRTKVIIYD
jgi:hypothetical protein